MGDNGTTYFKDFWEWDQTTNVWTQKADFGGIARSGAVGFTIGNKGYIGTGYNDSTYPHDFWEWDKTTNVWTKKADYPGGSAGVAVGFSIGNKPVFRTFSGHPCKSL
jgi:N-acetylneuraminic acid mutarotase